VTLGPVVSGTGLAEDKVIRAEELTERTSTNGVHGTRFKIHEDGTGHVSATGGFVEIDVDALQLKVGVAVVGSGRINSVLIGDNFPKLGTDLVAALTTLDMNDFTHFD